MYSSEDLWRLYVEYQSEWVPRGLTMLAVLSQDELLEFERMLETAPEVYDYCANMTDEQLNHLIAFISRNKESVFLELRHVKEDRDAKARALEEKDRVIREKNKALEKDSIVNCDETWCKVRRFNKYMKKYMWVLVNKAERIVIFFHDEGSRGPEGPHGLHGRGRGEGYNDRRLHGVQLPRREAGSRPPDLHGARAREVQEGPMEQALSYFDHFKDGLFLYRRDGR